MLLRAAALASPRAASPRGVASPSARRVARASTRTHLIIPRAHRARGLSPLAATAGDDDDVVDVEATSAPSSSSSSSSSSTLSALDALLGTTPSDDDAPSTSRSYDDDDGAAVISAPILWMSTPGRGASQRAGDNSGGVASALTSAAGAGSVYVAITLGLPDRSTKSQRERGVKGVELDFCVDTACSTNFILPQVAYGLDMQIVGTSPAGQGATGAVSAGQEMLLGTAKLGGNGDDGVAAITGLSAGVVPVPAPGTAGILGRSFLNCFGAVAFEWGGDRERARVDFWQAFDYAEAEKEGGLESFALNELPCGLLAVGVTVNGVSMPALVDTGAPQTIINKAAAERAGVIVGGESGESGESDGDGGGMNPFSGLVKAIKKGRERAMQDRGVMVMGAGGTPERLDRVDGAGVRLKVTGGGADGVDVFCEGVLVGELAAFQAGLGLAPGAPGVILGLDALMSRPRVVMSTAPGSPKIAL
ncbi:uncharacterized protein MICPUCDRAFT_66169 [Micromonas pusilla CCMP1545]|uniref:Predicted protein n=2 Tax=Micromonas pusilla TaxID=38833 RepID=C1N7P7_MICPC|nr:uncharacterized protein MICPUCDRAFT_66169 [Micromonas pusilla CCMP1545]EEH51567.1 predicted protein [Micromonas pusilla CCMP1545]|eukprot:XP_003063945.1 predicted protein [Micromonas pusilla CCMP1545]